MPISLYWDAEVFTSSTVKCAVLKSAFSWNRRTQTTYSDVSSYEVSGTNYTAGGATVAGKTKTLDSTEDVFVFDCNDVTWTNVTWTDGRYLVFYFTSTGKIIGVFQSAEVMNPAGADVTFQVSVNGLFRIRAL